MKKSTLLKTSAIALGALACLFLVGTDTKAADTEPDTENCYYAGIVAYCEAYYSTDCGDGTFDESCRHLELGPSVGWNVGGGTSLESCQIALDALLVDAAHAGCLVQEGSPRCYESTTGLCHETVDPPELF